MQKFTRPLTREVEVGGERLAFTLSESGIAVRPVGSRKPPREIAWSQVLCHMTGTATTGTAGPSPDEMNEALKALRKGAEGARQEAANQDAPVEADVPEEVSIAPPSTPQTAGSPTAGSGDLFGAPNGPG